MINNDVLRSVRYILNISDARIAEIIGLAGGSVTREDVVAFLEREGEDGFRDCPDDAMARFLNGLVIHMRGKDELRPAQPLDLPLSNNTILKKLRVAFNLKEDDMLAVFALAGLTINKPTLSALFRKETHMNYRPCGDQFLRNFLKGLTLRLRGPSPEA